MNSVYFIQEGIFRGEGPIKIGYSRNVESRLTNLQMGSSKELFLLGTLRGGRELEGKLHSRFNEYRLRGEWFSWCETFYRDILRLLVLEKHKLVLEKHKLETFKELKEKAVCYRWTDLSFECNRQNRGQQVHLLLPGGVWVPDCYWRGILGEQEDHFKIEVAKIVQVSLDKELGSYIFHSYPDEEARIEDILHFYIVRADTDDDVDEFTVRRYKSDIKALDQKYSELRVSEIPRMDFSVSEAKEGWKKIEWQRADYRVSLLVERLKKKPEEKESE